MGIPLVSNDSDSEEKIQWKASLNKDKLKKECQQTPAGKYDESGDIGICLMIYDEERRPSDMEVEGITPSGELVLEDKETGKKVKLE